MSYKPLHLLPTFSKAEVFLGKIIGTGAYSNVYLGSVRNDSTLGQISVKVPRKSTEEDVRAEVECMTSLNHVNIIRLVGIAVGITAYGPDAGNELTWMLMDYADKGDLLDFMKERSDKNLEMDFKLWTQLSLDIAEGMQYLHSRLIVHCDLHTKNCFVNKYNVAKVGDFGFAYPLPLEQDELDILRHPFGDLGRPKGIPTRHVNGVRWKAPEYIPGPYFPPVQLRPGDVWAYGVLLHEFWSEGIQPYEALEHDEDVVDAILDEKTPMDFGHPAVPTVILELIDKCFAYAPNHRPKFSEIVEKLKAAQLLWYDTYPMEDQQL